MNYEVSIPTSAASRNLKISLIGAAVALVLVILDVAWWLICPAIGVAGGFFLSSIYCVLDIQEWRMKQEQKILESLNEIKGK